MIPIHIPAMDFSMMAIDAMKQIIRSGARPHGDTAPKRAAGKGDVDQRHDSHNHVTHQPPSFFVVSSVVFVVSSVVLSSVTTMTSSRCKKIHNRLDNSGFFHSILATVLVLMISPISSPLGKYASSIPDVMILSPGIKSASSGRYSMLSMAVANRNHRHCPTMPLSLVRSTMPAHVASAVNQSHHLAPVGACVDHTPHQAFVN